MSLYAEYIKERTNKEIIESNQGFATYSFAEAGVYIEDIYVQPEHRKSGIASKLADQIVEIAKSKGISKLYGSVVPSASGSTASCSVLIAYGMRLSSSTNNFILFEKDI